MRQQIWTGKGRSQNEEHTDIIQFLPFNEFIKNRDFFHNLNWLKKRKAQNCRYCILCSARPLNTGDAEKGDKGSCCGGGDALCLNRIEKQKNIKIWILAETFLKRVSDPKKEDRGKEVWKKYFLMLVTSGIFWHIMIIRKI